MLGLASSKYGNTVRLLTLIVDRGQIIICCRWRQCWCEEPAWAQWRVSRARAHLRPNGITVNFAIGCQEPATDNTRSTVHNSDTALMPTADHSLTASVIIALEYWLRLANEQFFYSSSSIMTCNQSYIMSILFNCVLFSSVLWHCWLASVLWRCWLGGRKGIRPVKNWLVRCWHSYLSGARCRLAYGPADATATHCLLLQ